MPYENTYETFPNLEALATRAKALQADGYHILKAMERVGDGDTPDPSCDGWGAKGACKWVGLDALRGTQDILLRLEGFKALRESDLDVIRRS